MTSISRAFAVRSLSAFLLAGLLAAGVACAPGSRSRGKPAPPPAAPGPWAPRSEVKRRPLLPADPDATVPKDDYVGKDGCLDCHKDRVRTLAGSFHASLQEKGNPSTGCEECHGPGLEHVGYADERGIRHPVKAPREESNTVCLRCHAAVLERPVAGHRTWVDARKVACASCHLVHFARGDRAAAHERPAAAAMADLEAAGAKPLAAELCLKCHPDAHPDMARSGHRDLMAGEKSCGECHGNGSLHAAAGGLENLILLPTKQDAAEADRTCIACHEEAERPLLAWTCSEHRRENVACVACHDPNAAQGRTLLKEDPALCVDCHGDVGAEFRLPFRHRVPEGTMKCADCHDPHGNEAGLHRLELTRDACVRCHPEKGGPFVYDHTAKTLEGCTVCHRPHGSPNKRLLETREVRTLCLSCHPDLPLSHDQKPGSVYRDCMRCHVEIHGSDVNPRLHR